MIVDISKTNAGALIEAANVQTEIQKLEDALTEQRSKLESILSDGLVNDGGSKRGKRPMTAEHKAKLKNAWAKRKQVKAEQVSSAKTTSTSKPTQKKAS